MGVRPWWVLVTSTYSASSSLRRCVDRLPAVISSSSCSRGNDIWSPTGSVARVAVMRRRAATWMTGSSSMTNLPDHQGEVHRRHQKPAAPTDRHHQVVVREPEEGRD